MLVKLKDHNSTTCSSSVQRQWNEDYNCKMNRCWQYPSTDKEYPWSVLFFLTSRHINIKQKLNPHSDILSKEKKTYFSTRVPFKSKLLSSFCHLDHALSICLLIIHHQLNQTATVLLLFWMQDQWKWVTSLCYFPRILLKPKGDVQTQNPWFADT